MGSKITRWFFFGSLLLALWAVPTSGQALNLEKECTCLDDEGKTIKCACADTYFCATGFDTNDDGQVDTQALPYPGNPSSSITSKLGGMTAPMAYYPDASRQLSDAGLLKLQGAGGTYATPEGDCALKFRTVLYPSDPAAVLKAWYTKAIQEFNLVLLLEAEEYFRAALRVDPWNKDALDGLLEVYYARAEGLMMIGNDYIATAYGHKFNPDELQQGQSIIDLELKDINAALISYEVGFREFVKLFTSKFKGTGDEYKDYLEIDPEGLFFEQTYPDPNADPEQEVLIAYESLRGQENAIGVASRALDVNGETVRPVQGSPNFGIIINDISSSDAAQINEMYAQLSQPGASVENITRFQENAAGTMSVRQKLALDEVSSQKKQWDVLDAPVKFWFPEVESGASYGPGGQFILEFNVYVDPEEPIKVIEMLIEFDHERLIGPTNINQLNFSESSFDGTHILYLPGNQYNGVTLHANQMLVRAEASSPLYSEDPNHKLRIVKVPFQIKQTSGECYVYAAGSGGSLCSGFKDITILFRLAAAHADAAAEKVRRQYSAGDTNVAQQCIAFIEDEMELIGGWFEFAQALLAKGATVEELKSIDPLQSAINNVSAQLGKLSAFREFIRSGANGFGYPPDYVPFYDSAAGDTFTAIGTMVIGSTTEGFDAEEAGGHFGAARAAEAGAILAKARYDDTKDKIRNEIFTINLDTESRLAQICGRININGEPGTAASDAIDYEMRASAKNPLCQIGQQVLLLDKARLAQEKAYEEIKVALENIDLDVLYVKQAVDLKRNQNELIAQYSLMQEKYTKEIGFINGDQANRNAQALAAATICKATNWSAPVTGEIGGAIAAAGVSLMNGIEQERLERQKGELNAKKEALNAEERIKLAEIDTELWKLLEEKQIQQNLNRIAVMNIDAAMSDIEVIMALGNLHSLILERAELLARRARSLANLGEMSFADPSFRLTQCKSVRDAATQLEFLKQWLYIWTRALYYKWALPDDQRIQPNLNLPEIGIDDIRRIQVVGAKSADVSTPLEDELTAADYVQVLLAFDQDQYLQALVEVTGQGLDAIKNDSARYSLREDFLRIARTANTPAEDKRVKDAFRAWFTSPDRLDEEGNMVIEFDTTGHLSDYDLPLSDSHNEWINFSLRPFSDKPLWNHKISKVGVILRASGNAFKSGDNASASIEFGGTGYVHGNSNEADDFRVYRMSQWKKNDKGGLEPIEVRTIPLVIRASTDVANIDLQASLAERPVVSTLWRLKILKGQLSKIEMNNIEDVLIFISSKAFQSQ